MQQLCPVLSRAAIDAFRTEIRTYFHSHVRDLPWRHTGDPYRIYVSEMMLQQTQAERVVGKYERFIEEFPDFQMIADAPLVHVVESWSGLGYNRRAIYLQNTARRIVNEYGGELPSDPEVLETLPGIGHATAREIAAFAFRKPVVFIETNIRRVFIHFFFHDREGIHDRDILPLVEQTLERDDPRNWYYALFDYGVMLKRTLPNPNRRSAHYQKQSQFEGSNRQLRGKILRLITAHPGISAEEIVKLLETDRDRIEQNIARMIAEGFLLDKSGRYSIR